MWFELTVFQRLDYIYPILRFHRTVFQRLDYGYLILRFHRTGTTDIQLKKKTFLKNKGSKVQKQNWWNFVDDGVSVAFLPTLIKRCGDICLPRIMNKHTCTYVIVNYFIMMKKTSNLVCNNVFHIVLTMAIIPIINAEEEFSVHDWFKLVGSNIFF